MPGEPTELVEKLLQIFSNTKIGEIMTSPAIVVTPETSIRQVKDIMKIKKISGLPVVKKGLKLVGIISIEDIIKVLEKGNLSDFVLKWMTKSVVTINEEDTLSKFVELSQSHKYGRYPVLNNEGKVVGIITKYDVITWLFGKLGSIYVHDQRREKVLNREEYISKLTGDILQNKTASFEFKIDYNDITKIGIGATRLKSFLKKKGIDEKLVRKISIATYEAEANVVIHSESYGEIYCWELEDSIRLLIKDYGKGIENVELAMQEGYSTATEEVRAQGFGAGMGLPNMKRFSDKMTIISESGKGVIIEMLFFK
ncbi:putative transcriptional regulator, contains C-terminal CBS domains [Marinitoga piezophila KA3]|uniref:Putative transcriptional regulator, contains C-terminal CBS domains n=1 Tax=Marinitoga piezophila (strain DSM 14283 / JCM 11233 / KA3) TaxID=443254 RepID=H2J6Q3_MARPK|nr:MULTISPECIES: CBS domain-containing protein [Marinitoga]AEX86334.1 putative transcriptional regulator, contains C-terminal CBS domains [Marinitoga piezophila KA3]APT76732.1 serine/threonine protein kinase [Marinitoga sp. 1137]NUU98428.1 serine/threonine protein kinase [Marinitoga sp. 1138]